MIARLVIKLTYKETVQDSREDSSIQGRYFFIQYKEMGFVVYPLVYCEIWLTPRHLSIIPRTFGPNRVESKS